MQPLEKHFTAIKLDTTAKKLEKKDYRIDDFHIHSDGDIVPVFFNPYTPSSGFIQLDWNYIIAYGKTFIQGEKIGDKFKKPIAKRVHGRARLYKVLGRNSSNYETHYFGDFDITVSGISE